MVPSRGVEPAIARSSGGSITVMLTGEKMAEGNRVERLSFQIAQFSRLVGNHLPLPSVADEEGIEPPQPFRVASLANSCVYLFRHPSVKLAGRG